MSQSLLSLLSNEKLNDFLKESTGDLWLGLSGGVDSVVLLHLLVSNYFTSDNKSNAKYPLRRLKAIHINHDLSPYADYWQAQSHALCQQHNVYFEAHKVNVKRYGKSLEEAARLARYDVFSKRVQNNDALLLAHHANDQAETILFRLLRGTGGKGVSGIPSDRELSTMSGSAALIRPLLMYSKQALLDYAKHYQLSWVEDESNLNTQYSRNFIRHNVMPVLQEFESEAAVKITKSAQRLAFDYRMLEQLAKEKMAHWLNSDGSLFLQHLELLALDEKHFWLRHYLQRFSISLTQPQLAELEQAMFAEKDRQPCLDLAKQRLMRYQDSLYVLPAKLEPELGVLLADQTTERTYDKITLFLLENSTLKMSGFSLIARPNSVMLTLPNGQSRKLKKWLNDEKIPAWWRDHLPYISYQGELVAIGSLWLAPVMKDVLKIEWQRSGKLPWPSVY